MATISMQNTPVVPPPIDPEKTYSLSFLVQKGLFGKVKSFSTARSHVQQDLLSEGPVLRAVIDGEGLHRSITIRGANLIAYLEKQGITPLTTI